MKRLPGEQDLIKSSNDGIVLTNQRIWLKEGGLGNAYSIAIFLEDVSSVESRYKSNPLYLVIGLVGVLLIIYQLITDVNGDTSIYITGAAIAGIFLLVWVTTRQHLISVSSKGGATLNYEIGQLKSKSVQKFIDDIQEAKANRIETLYNIKSRQTNSNEE